MEKSKWEVAVSYLPTRDDFADFRVTAVRTAFSKKEAVACRLIGLFMVLAGIMLWALFGRVFSHVLTDVLLVIVGLLIGFFHDVLQPYFVRRSAFFYFEGHKEQMIAHTFFFNEVKLEIKTDRYILSINYNDLYRAYEDKKTFVFFTGRDEMRFLPKRVLSPEDVKAIEASLDAGMKAKKHQEGTREWMRS